MKKYLILTLAVLASIGAGAQIKVTQGNNSQPFKITKQPNFTSFSNDNANYFLMNRSEHFVKINTLVIADKTGNISTATDIIQNHNKNNETKKRKQKEKRKTEEAFIEN